MADSLRAGPSWTRHSRGVLCAAAAAVAVAARSSGTHAVTLSAPVRKYQLAASLCRAQAPRGSTLRGRGRSGRGAVVVSCAAAAAAAACAALYGGTHAVTLTTTCTRCARVQFSTASKHLSCTGTTMVDSLQADPSWARRSRGVLCVAASAAACQLRHACCRTDGASAQVSADSEPLSCTGTTVADFALADPSWARRIHSVPCVAAAVADASAARHYVTNTDTLTTTCCASVQVSADSTTLSCTATKVADSCWAEPSWARRIHSVRCAAAAVSDASAARHCVTNADTLTTTCCASVQVSADCMPLSCTGTANSNVAVNVGCITIPSHSKPATSILTGPVASASVSDPFMAVEREMTQ